MIELLALTLALSCGASEPPFPPTFVDVALDLYQTVGDRKIVVAPDHPLVSLYGTERPELPTEPTSRFSEGIAYDVWVDPIYDETCFSDIVDSVLLDDRSWPGLRRAEAGETPQFWVTLTAPAAACGSSKNPRASCTWNHRDGTGIVAINAYRWVRGYGYPDDQAMILNHEVGHILGFGHFECSVMGAPPWNPEAGPAYETEWDGCGTAPAWPTETEKTAAGQVYSDRWLAGVEGLWNGAGFTSRYLTGS